MTAESGEAREPWFAAYERDALHRKFEEVTASLEPDPWPVSPPCPEPSLPRAILGALWGLVWPWS